MFLLRSRPDSAPVPRTTLPGPTGESWLPLRAVSRSGGADMWKVGNAPTSWGIEQAHDPSYPEWAAVLDEIAKAGYAGIELGPLGYLPREPDVLQRELS